MSSKIYIGMSFILILILLPLFFRRTCEGMEEPPTDDKTDEQSDEQTDEQTDDPPPPTYDASTYDASTYEAPPATYEAPPTTSEAPPPKDQHQNKAPPIPTLSFPQIPEKVEPSAPSNSATHISFSPPTCQQLPVAPPPPPCPPCARCPEPSFECKKVPSYSSENKYLPSLGPFNTSGPSNY